MFEAKADIVANVWKVVARVGDHVGRGDTIAVLETMKMEIPVYAAQAGTVRSIMTQQGSFVQEGDVIAILDEAV